MKFLVNDTPIKTWKDLLGVLFSIGLVFVFMMYSTPLVNLLKTTFLFVFVSISTFFSGLWSVVMDYPMQITAVCALLILFRGRSRPEHKEEPDDFEDF
ncbi:MAG TPA: hypothetical protein VF974_08295 [Patescibacteria group bacterium]